MKGVQKFNVTDNIFSNPGMDYELLAGIKTAMVSNYLNAEQNFWGTANINRCYHFPIPTLGCFIRIWRI